MSGDALHQCSDDDFCHSVSDLDFFNSLQPFHAFDELNGSIDCKYFDISKFNSSFSNSEVLSFFHLNINSLPKHFDDLTNLLDSLSVSFGVIGISETRLNSIMADSHNIDIPGYSHVLTPTESSAGGTCLYVSDSLTLLH